ncbi:F151B-like protein [Mya arenaria]|uniref:F151B-like protein n=1 Tax=Mya arenaria TaxID=6604 RepID=A0ABY7FLC8_MYAAR|nr:uncharacterized protein LOC128212942 [Mya arenaria]WAR23013.1 F151B-like protein [Mya arenaria]
MEKFLKKITFDVNVEKDMETFGRLLGNKKVKQHLIQRCSCLGIAVFLWVYFNGGLLPRAWRQQIPMLRIGSDANVLVFFPESQENGANIKWARACNTEEKLQRALYSSDIQMIEADVMLRGQGTEKQELTPVMAELPDTDGQLTFDRWLDNVIKASSKGFKLDFQAIDALEVTLQKLQDRKEEITVPVWLHADVLQGPLGGAPRVDSTRFIKVIKKMFPTCTLSLGWTTGSHTDVSQLSYTWDMVLDMYHIIHKMEVNKPVVFSVRASFLENSVPQLKWLIDNTKSSILVWQHPRDMDAQDSQSLKYLCYRFPAHNAFFDLTNEKLLEMVQNNRVISSVQELDARVGMRDSLKFRPEAWVKMGFHMDAHSLMASSEAIVLQSRAVYMVTKAKYTPNPNVKLEGRVHFLDRKNLKEEVGKTGLSIYVRSKEYMHFEDIKGIKCFIGVDGEIVVESNNMPGKAFRESHRVTPGSANCYRFTVKDEGKELVFIVTVLPECHTLESSKPFDRVPAEVRVLLPPDIGGFEVEHPFIVKLEDSKRTAVLDELTVSLT